MDWGKWELQIFTSRQVNIFPHKQTHDHEDVSDRGQFGDGRSDEGLGSRQLRLGDRGRGE